MKFLKSFSGKIEKIEFQPLIKKKKSISHCYGAKLFRFSQNEFKSDSQMLKSDSQTFFWADYEGNFVFKTEDRLSLSSKVMDGLP